MNGRSGGRLLRLLEESRDRSDDQAPLSNSPEESGLRQRIDAMFRGDKINRTENRAVLHVALRAPRGASIVVDGHDVVPDVHDVLQKWPTSATASGPERGRDIPGSAFATSSTSGSAGSDLGPVMAYEALKHYSERAMTFRFVSNIDGADFAEAVTISILRKLFSSSLRKRSRRWRR